MHGKWQVSALKVLFLVIICNRGYDVDRTMCDLVSKNRSPEDVSEEIAAPFAAIIKISGDNMEGVGVSRSKPSRGEEAWPLSLMYCLRD
jgi:hypothetical protein